LRAQVGQGAPAFKLRDAQGKVVQLSDFAGQRVVLEWFNPDCPFTQKHYNSGNMPATQQKAMAHGVVWISVNSDARDPIGKAAAAQAGELVHWLTAKGAKPTTVLLDADGALGRAYGARTTPHVFVLDTQGKLIYGGAIDSIASAKPADIARATNYVTQALQENLAGKPVSQPKTAPYGCGIRYAAPAG
jgi:peroxiredoxin